MLLSQCLIDWCHWICHRAESSEKKDHIHFVLKPSKRIDTASLNKFFLEIDPNNALPLKPTSDWRPVSSMDDWLLYAVHDSDYLKSKSQKREIIYMKKDLQTTDEDALNEAWNCIDRMKFARLRALEDAVARQIPFARLVQDGIIPIAQRAQYERQYADLFYLLKTPVVTEDGEVISFDSTKECCHH